jgi:hypothetical protein
MTMRRRKRSILVYHENDGTSRVAISGSAVPTRQQLCVWCDTEGAVISYVTQRDRQLLCDTEGPSVVCSLNSEPCAVVMFTVLVTVHSRAPY